MRTTLRRLAAPVVYRTTWGMEGVFGATGDDLAAAIKRARFGCAAPADAAAGAAQLFDGIEFCAGMFYPFIGQDTTVAELLRAHDMTAIVQVHTCGYPVPSAFPMNHPRTAGVKGGRGLIQPAWKEHSDSLKFHLEDTLKRLPRDVIAVFNVHSGKDSMQHDDAVRFLEAACEVERSFGVPVCHETHRQRLFHNPMVLQALRRDLPATLKLNADLSHFVTSLERIPSDELDAEFWPDVMDVLCRRVYMMHARVGLEQSIQLQDPRPYYTAISDGKADDADTLAALPHMHAVQAHLSWWKQIAAAMAERDVPIRVVPEYGPPPYQTEGDAATLEAICEASAVFLRKALTVAEPTNDDSLCSS